MYFLLISLVLLTPFIYSDDLYNSLISAKQIWFYGSMALLVPAYAFKQLFDGKRRYFRLNIVDIALLTFYIYFFIRAVFTPYTPLARNIRLINYSLLLLFYFIVKQLSVGSSGLSSHEKGKNKIIDLSEILVVVLMLTGLIQAIWGLLQLYGTTRNFHSGFRITGTFFNPTPYALYLAAVFPLALAKLLLFKETANEKDDADKKSWEPSPLSQIWQFLYSSIRLLSISKITYFISLLTVISIILVLLVTMNRASWLGVSTGSLLVFNYRYSLFNKAVSYLHNTSRKLIAGSVVILLTAITVTALYLLKKGSSDSRLFIWEVTLGKIAKKTLFGHGIGRFEAEHNNWQAEYFRSNPEDTDSQKGMVAGNTKYCFNEYLEMASELGIFGLLLFLVIIVPLFLPERYVVMLLWRYAGRIPQPALLSRPPPPAPCPLPSLISLLVCALISFPFYSMPTLILLVTLLALISAQKAPVKDIHFPVIAQKLLRLTSSVLLIGGGILLAGFTKKQYKSYYIMDEAVTLHQTGSYDESCNSFQRCMDGMKYKGQYLQFFAKALLIGGRYEESIRMYERAKNYTADDMLYCSAMHIES